MPDSSGACLSCGAALAPGADRCALCGTPAGETDPTDALSAPPPSPNLASEDVGQSVSPGSAECSRCGHVNPDGSRYCNRCGEPLATASPSLPPETPEASGERPPSDVGKRAMLFVGVAIAAVLGLYGAQVLLGNSDAAELEPEPNTAATPAGAAAPAANPLPPGPAPPLPAEAAQQVAAFEARDTADGYFEAARYYLTAAFQAQTTEPDNSRLWAREAMDRLERSLELEDDPNVRIALAEASVFEGTDPMRPIQEARAVLDADSTHPGANLFIGQRRLMINRVDEARRAFETVIANTQPGEDARERAEEALAMIENGVPGVEQP